MLLRGTESHHLLDAAAVTRPVEQHDLALAGNCEDVGLVIPLSAFAIIQTGRVIATRDARTEGALVR